VERRINLGYDTKPKSTLIVSDMGKQFLPVLYAPRPVLSHVAYLLSWVLGNECDTLLDILVIRELANVRRYSWGKRGKDEDIVVGHTFFKSAKAASKSFCSSPVIFPTS
jgi:hypothetical protein